MRRVTHFAINTIRFLIAAFLASVCGSLIIFGVAVGFDLRPSDDVTRSLIVFFFPVMWYLTGQAFVRVRLLAAEQVLSLQRVIGLQVLTGLLLLITVKAAIM
jgi:hypothetical protein